ncbi:MAG: HdeD family acid-resistance protein [Actinobacteria bacterium]|nr:HdeD family acid-resistance protein [Actinomycetota bacterium]
MKERNEQGPVEKQERYHPLREILQRDRESLRDTVRKIDTTLGNWWEYYLKGAISIAFGIVLAAWPGETLLFLVVVFGIQALVKGVIGLAHAISLAVKKQRWLLLLMESVAGLILGIALVADPHASLETAAVLIGIWMIATGLSHLAIAYRDPSKVQKGLMGTGGLLTVIIGILLVAVPMETVEIAHTLSAIQALVIGVIFVIAGSYILVKSPKRETTDASEESSTRD